jgi:hypothetical protein
MPVSLMQSSFAFSHNFESIYESINFPVKENTLLNFFVIMPELITDKMIRNKITNHNIFIIAR